MAPAKAVLDAFLGFFYPEICQICRSVRAGPAEGYVCRGCASHPGAVQWIEPPFCARCGLPWPGDLPESFVCRNCGDQKLYFETARSAVKYSGLVAHLIQEYKYRQRLWFEPFLADLLARKAAPVLAAEKWDLIAPVPLHPLKERERGFNQAARLSQRLSRTVQVPFAGRLLKRVKPTNTQTRLDREERAHNVANAFAFARKSPLRGERIVLVDDVLTTGATANACARELMDNGAGAVSVWTVARNPFKQ